MKFTCSRVALLDAMKIALAAVASRTTKPILANVKAVASADRLTLTAQDMEIGIRYELRGVTVAKTGEAILAAAQLTAILRETDDAEVSITATDDGATVRVGSSKFETLGYPVAEFPDLPEVDDAANYHEATAGDLRLLVQRTAFAADKKDSTRFALSGVLWEADKKGVRAVATDSKRLSVCERPATIHGDAPDAKRSHLLPAKALSLLVANITDDAEAVRITLRPNEAMFRTERAMIYTRLIEGRFPPYEQILAQAKKLANKTIVLPAQALFSRVKQAAVMTDQESKRLDLRFEAGKVTMKARGAESGSSEVVMMLPEYDGPAVAIAFDPQYVTEFLRTVVAENTGANVVLELSDGDKPAMFSVGDDYRYMVMPLAG